MKQIWIIFHTPPDSPTTPEKVRTTLVIKNTDARNMMIYGALSFIFRAHLIAAVAGNHPVRNRNIRIVEVEEHLFRLLSSAEVSISAEGDFCKLPVKILGSLGIDCFP